jgi:hypothetical protein
MAVDARPAGRLVRDDLGNRNALACDDDLLAAFDKLDRLGEPRLRFVHVHPHHH